jgi:hypothetical protein
MKMLINKINQFPRRQSAFWASALMLMVYFFCQPNSASAQSQWTTNGNNISNTNTGNVGIGTTTPNGKLDVYGGRIVVQPSASGGFMLINDPVWGNAGLFETTSNGDLHLKAYSSGFATPQLFLKNGGNVGIGTTFPSSNLHIYTTTNNPALIVESSAAVTPALEFRDGSTTQNRWRVGSGMLTQTDGKFGVYDARQSQFRFVIDTTGNIGIGTASPLAQLHFGTAINSGVKTYTSSATDHGLLFNSYMDSNAPYRRYGDIVAMSNQDGISGGSIIRFLTNPHNSFTASERMRIDYLGNVGIGTNTPGQRLVVYGGADTALQIGDRGMSGSVGLQFLGSGYKHAGVRFDGDNLIVENASNTGLPSTWYNGQPMNIVVRNGNLNVAAGGLCIAGDCKTSWSQVGGGATSVAANVSAGQFGANTGGGNFSFPASVLMSGSAGAIIDSGGSNRFRVCGPSGSCSLAGEYIGGRIRLSPDGSFASAESGADPGMGGINAPGNAYLGGNVGIGTATPTARLDVNGDAKITGNINVTGNINAKYQDVAEWVTANHALPAGTVVTLNPTKSNQVMASTRSYDAGVAGVVSERPGLALGEAGADKVLVATTGRVKIKVDATRAAIHIGDLLVTSDREGYAMKSEPMVIGGRQFHAPGTLIGKALEPLESGTGEILVLLSLQ